MKDFDGKVAVITGAAGGIGAATARVLFSAGAKVVVADRDESGERVAAEVDGVYVRADVSREADAERLAESATARFGRLDVLVNCAGVVLAKSTTETTVAEWERVLGINLTGTWLCSKAAIPRMAHGAAIVNVASNAGLVGFANAAAYCASKGGVTQLTRAMALDCAPLGIRVNAVCPGHTRTPMAESFVAAQADPVTFVRDFVELQHPLGRMAEPEEVGHCIAYLASDSASFITGALIAVDGGFTAR